MQPRTTTLRFIPTRVGNTNVLPVDKSSESVHPHACGEHDRVVSELAKIAGSSPRVWGTRLTVYFRASQIRFIPTRVGNTCPPLLGHSLTTVHPHACGEHRRPLPPTAHATGSSPRVWGTHDLNSPNNGFMRFIPTRVGNTCPWP